MARPVLRTTARGKQGPVGPQGERGPQGDQGPQGERGLPGVNAVPADEAVAGYIDANDSATHSALAEQVGAEIETEGTPARTALNAAIAEAAAQPTGGFGPIHARALFRDTQVIPVVFFGSSSTAGSNVAEPDRWVTKVAAAITTTPVPYPSYAEANLAVNNSAPGFLFINLGVSGVNTSNYIDPARITQIGSWEPALVVHMIGTNDTILAGRTAEQAAANVAANIDAIDAAATLPVGHLYIHQHERYDQAKVYPWSEHLAAMRRMAASRHNVSVLDLNEQFVSVGIPSTDPLGLMETDEVHVNELGHAFYAQRVTEALGLPTLPTDPPSPAPEPGVGATLLLDNFNRADGNLAGSAATTGQTWTVPAGTINVTGNRMVPATGSGVTGLIDCGTSEVDILTDVSYVGAGLAGVVFRAEDVNTNRWGAFLDGANIKIYRLVSSTTTVVATQPSPVPTTGDHTLRVRAEGDTVTVWIDAVKAMTYTMTSGDATASAAWTQVGTRTSSAAATWDNFTVRATA